MSLPLSARGQSGEPPLSTSANPEEIAEFPSVLSDGLSWVSKAGKEDSSLCAICGTKLGKRHLNPRHNCRICGRFVCASCSPNSVQVQGIEKQRACVDCMANVEKTPALIGRIVGLGERLSALGGPVTPNPPRPGCSIEEAVHYCELAMTSMEHAHTKQAASQASQMSKLESEVRVARSTVVRFAYRLHALARTRAPPEVEGGGGLGEALAVCEAALSTLEAEKGGRSSRSSLCRNSERSTAPSLVTNDGGQMRTPLCGGDAAQGSVQAVSQTDDYARGSCCSRRGQRIWFLVGILLLVVAVVMAGLYFMFPSITQKLVDATDVTLVHAVMSRPTASTVRMTTSVVLNNAGPFSATISSFHATLSSEGREFGWCVFPEVQTVPNGPTPVIMDTELFVTDSAAFAAATRPVLQGLPGAWDISGLPELRVMGITVQVEMRKQLLLPPTKLKQVIATNIDALGGTETQLHATSDVSFFSSSVLEMRDMGHFTFSMHPSRPDGSIIDDVQIGTVTMENFQVFRDSNEVKGSSITLTKTVASEPYLSAFIGNWVSGNSQRCYIKGPVGSDSPFLNDLTTQEVDVLGLAEGTIKSAFISNSRTLKGHVPETGKPCSAIEGTDCLRGSVINMGNPLHHAMVLRNMSFDVFMDKPLSYNVTIHEAFVPRKVSCDKGTRFARMYSAPGMWSYMNASRNEDVQAVIPAARPGMDQALTSFFLPGVPQPGQGGGDACFGLPALDPQDCCFTTLMAAASCRALSEELSYIPVSLTGNTTMSIGDFSLDIAVAQTAIPITFAEDVPAFQVGPVSLSCSDFAFL